MSDPAMEAARRAFADYWPDQGDFEFAHSNEGRFGIDAAREALAPIRELHKPSEWWNCINACCSGEECRNRSRYCGTCDDSDWPCATARLIYTSEELE